MVWVKRIKTYNSTPVLRTGTLDRCMDTDPHLPWCIDSSSLKNKTLGDPSQEEGHRVLHTSSLKPGGRRQGWEGI